MNDLFLFIFGVTVLVFAFVHFFLAFISTYSDKKEEKNKDNENL